MGETSCHPCLLHGGIDVRPYQRGELVEHLDRYGTFEERVFTEVDGSLLRDSCSREEESGPLSSN